MSSILKRARAFWESDDGATATEYAVMLALIILVCMTAIQALGEKVSGGFAEAESEFSNYYP
ncbi:MAG TPA: Flp family type IVb pilin [Phycisphaerae bacterium]|nr:Flp family type IVb pilin [Phycisphaerae bacterium]